MDRAYGSCSSALRLVVGAVLTATLTTSAAAQLAPRIDEVVWPWIDSYCTFMKADHTFDWNELESWRFVFFSGLPEEGEDIMTRSFMRIDGLLRQLGLQTMTDRGGSEVRTYVAYDDPPYVIELEATTGESGYESVGYTGTVTVSRFGLTSSAAFNGDYGVQDEILGFPTKTGGAIQRAILAKTSGQRKWQARFLPPVPVLR